ncbi:hypothetical protein BV22DRAFT_1128374 [Leucogyrophana mollusca]|uniref:Uncharacterized protein n=1 Tax=Leucogyrophana mollusca TaxID=85980 RepID=A0ACB8BLV9_9AGAM|nr:hypothetical protein BV22DRAFT_1128374 [Leucogyrophana mollusca]
MAMDLGGNQRDMDRAKAQKKAAAQAKKPKESATSLAKRKEADTESQAEGMDQLSHFLTCGKKDEEKAAAGAASGGGGK